MVSVKPFKWYTSSYWVYNEITHLSSPKASVPHYKKLQRKIGTKYSHKEIAVMEIVSWILKVEKFTQIEYAKKEL